MQAISCAGPPVSTIARMRAKGLRQWLRENAPSCIQEQKHLDEGSAERAYWHYGYLSALQDILKLMSSVN
jgi:hypothetical protein